MFAKVGVVRYGGRRGFLLGRHCITATAVSQHAAAVAETQQLGSRQTHTVKRDSNTYESMSRIGK